MTEPVVSVVIPTRNRSSILVGTLAALSRQRVAGGPFEVVVADDGSTDDTRELLDAADVPFELKTVLLDQRGPARARNAAIRCAAGRRVLLLGDDTVPSPETVAIHGAAAGEPMQGLQGAIQWDPEVGITDLMRFLAPAGPQFWFKGLATGSLVPWSSVVSSNLSAPRDWFLEEPFDEGFSCASMEDTELAWRWSRRGWRVFFDADACCLHRHRYDDIRTVLARQRSAGRWARRVIRLHPGLLSAIVLRPIFLIPVVAIRGAATSLRGGDRRSWLWDLRCRLAFVSGFVTGRE